MPAAERVDMQATRRSPSVVVIDDHPLLVGGMCAALEQHGFETSQLDPQPFLQMDTQTWENTAAPAVDFAVVDLVMGDVTDAGIRFSRWLTAAGVRTVMLTGVEEQSRLDACLASGASGVLSKAMSVSDVVIAVGAIARGESLCSAADLADAVSRNLKAEAAQRESQERFESLSVRESAVLQLLMQGGNVSAIAEQSFVAESTVRSQVKSVLRKLAVSSQLEAVVLANSVGFEQHVDPNDR